MKPNSLFEHVFAHQWGVTSHKYCHLFFWASGFGTSAVWTWLLPSEDCTIICCRVSCNLMQRGANCAYMWSVIGAVILLMQHVMAGDAIWCYSPCRSGWSWYPWYLIRYLSKLLSRLIVMKIKVCICCPLYSVQYPQVQYSTSWNM